MTTRRRSRPKATALAACDGFALEVERARQRSLERMANLRLAVLLWGAGVGARTPAAKARIALRRALESDGHLVRYSEELFDARSRHSIMAQQVADVEAHDITFSIPASAGSIAEIHDFMRIPSVSSKIFAFLDNRYLRGYANKSLMALESTLTTRIHLYEGSDLPGCVVAAARGLCRRLQEGLYMAGRRS